MTFAYQPYYCEENIWHLCADERIPVPVAERRVLVLTGVRGRVAMLNQRAGGGKPVFWDYHVVLEARGEVWDLDTTLGLPVALDVWLRDSFLPEHPDFLPRFRVVGAPAYLENFASDRSHMLGRNGVPLKPPPPWPAIGRGMTLPRFVNMHAPFLGELHTIETLRRS